MKLKYKIKTDKWVPGQKSSGFRLTGIAKKAAPPAPHLRIQPAYRTPGEIRFDSEVAEKVKSMADSDPSKK